METVFKVGDKVWDMSISNEVGEVVEICDEDTYPVKVRFIDISSTYTFSGRRYTGYPKTLSLTPYIFAGFSQERPKKEPEIGSLCLFSNNKIEFNNNTGIVSTLYLISEGAYITNAGIWYNYCKQIEIKEV